MSGAIQGGDKGELLLRLAREALEESFRLHPRRSHEVEPWLEEIAATFVTLTRRGELRGCIGSLNPRRTLVEDVRTNARAAAFEDPRFKPLTLEELDEIEIEVSLLSPIEVLDVNSEEELLERLRPGVDGLVIEKGYHRGTFLPQVWQKLPDPRDFLHHLKRKAGLDPGFWPDGLRVSRYTVEEWREKRA